MKIRILSDLHLEFDLRVNKNLYKPKYCGEDVLILAGDVQVGLILDSWFCELLKDRDVVYILGNHEFYNHDYDDLRDQFEEWQNKVNNRAQSLGYKNKLYCLDDSSICLGDEHVKFVGSTLWTNFNHQDPIAMLTVAGMMNDFHLIRKEGRKFNVNDALEAHLKGVEFIQTEIQNLEENQKIVVISHHGPSELSVHPKYKGNKLNCCFYSDLDPLVEKTNLWIQGHTHESLDYNIGNSRVVCNPRGYFGYEMNTNFRGNLIVEI